MTKAFKNLLIQRQKRIQVVNICANIGCFTKQEYVHPILITSCDWLILALVADLDRQGKHLFKPPTTRLLFVINYEFGFVISVAVALGEICDLIYFKIHLAKMCHKNRKFNRNIHLKQHSLHFSKETSAFIYASCLNLSFFAVNRAQ